MKYDVEGTIKVEVSIEKIEANSEAEAIQKAKEIFGERYVLDVIGSYHNKDRDVEYDLYAWEIEDDE